MTIEDTIEQSRLKLQACLDSQRVLGTRKRLGQFATSTSLAGEMLQYAKSLLATESKIRFLDPAFGTGAFYSALLRVFPQARVEKAVGFEIDFEYAHVAKELWHNPSFALYTSDFSLAPQPKAEEQKFNLVICNPPYVRHHYLSVEEKLRLSKTVRTMTELELSGYSGLYCYFMLISHDWMTNEGLGGWLVPSEFMDVNYGKEVKRYLLNQVTLLRIHRFDPSEVQFKDAFVSSAVVWFRKEIPRPNHKVEFTYGGTLKTRYYSFYLD